MLKALTTRRMAVATLVVVLVVAAHVRKSFEQANPDCPQLLSFWKTEKEEA